MAGSLLARTIACILAVSVFAEAEEACASNGRHRRGQTQDQNQATEERGVADGLRQAEQEYVEQNAQLKADYDAVALQYRRLEEDLDRVSALLKEGALKLAVARLLQSDPTITPSLRTDTERDIRVLEEDQRNLSQEIAEGRRKLGGTEPGEGRWLQGEMADVNRRRDALDAEYHRLVVEAAAQASRQVRSPEAPAGVAEDDDGYTIAVFIARIDNRIAAARSERNAAAGVAGEDGKRAMLEAAARMANLSADRAELVAMRDKAARGRDAGAPLRLRDILLDEPAHRPASFALGLMDTVEEVRAAEARFDRLAAQVRAARASLLDLERALQVQQRVVSDEAAVTRALAQAQSGGAKSRLEAEATRLQAMARNLEDRADQASLDAATMRDRLKVAETRLADGRARLGIVADAATDPPVFVGDVESADDNEPEASRQRSRVVSLFELGAEGRPAVFSGEGIYDLMSSDAFVEEADAAGEDVEGANDNRRTVFGAYDMVEVVATGYATARDIAVRSDDGTWEAVADGAPAGLLGDSYARASDAHRAFLAAEAARFGLPPDGDALTLAQAVLAAREELNTDLERQVLEALSDVAEAVENEDDDPQETNWHLNHFERLEADRLENKRRIDDLKRDMAMLGR